MTVKLVYPFPLLTTLLGTYSRLAGSRSAMTGLRRLVVAVVLFATVSRHVFVVPG